MPAAKTKSELLDVSAEEWAKLNALIGEVPDDEAMTKDAEGTSIKDVIWHRAHWIGLFLGWYEDGQAGKDVAFPAPGYKWNDLKRYNADLREQQASLDWSAARMLMADNHARLMAFLEGKSQAALYDGPMKVANNAWTAGRWAEAAGPSHYRSAAKFIRARLKAAAAGR